MALNYHAQAIGLAVRAVILEAGITVADFGEQADIPRMSLYRRINGQVEFTYSELLKVCDIAGTTFAELVARAQKIAQRAA